MSTINRAKWLCHKLQSPDKLKDCTNTVFSKASKPNTAFVATQLVANAQEEAHFGLPLIGWVGQL